MSVGYLLARRIIVIVIGGTLLLLGLALLVLPGPGVLVLLGGLGVLATEFVWAKVWLNKLRSSFPRWKSSKEARP